MGNLSNARRDFLVKLVYKNSYNYINSNAVACVSNVAYTTFCRTLKFDSIKYLDKTQQEELKVSLKNSVTDFVKNQLAQLIELNENMDQEAYDNWHSQTCLGIINIYKNRDLQLMYGQAQKWLNISIKHLFILDIDEYRVLFADNFRKFLHIAVDNVIIKVAEEKLAIEAYKQSWSSWSQEQYIGYQKELRDKLIDCIPFDWELEAWQ